MIQSVLASWEVSYSRCVAYSEMLITILQGAVLELGDVVVFAGVQKTMGCWRTLNVNKKNDEKPTLW